MKIFLICIILWQPFQLSKGEVESSLAPGTLPCAACKLGFGMIQNFKAWDPYIYLFKTQIASFCSKTIIVPASQCVAMVNFFKEPLYICLLQDDRFEASHLCGHVLGPTCMEFAEEWDLSIPTTPKPAIESIPEPPPDTPMLKVLHLTDIHLDLEYTEGLNPYCHEALCCRANNRVTPQGGRLSGKWGDYYYCDTPERTLVSMLDHIAENHKIDVIYWTGDGPPHDTWNSTRERNREVFNIVNNYITAKFPGVPIFPSLGNHDSVPINFFTSSDAGEYSTPWFYEGLLDSWKDWVPDKSAAPTILKGGYYSVAFQEGFRIIALNSNFCNYYNFWLTINSTDPTQQLAWLTKELEKAEAAGEKVHILSHLPPGYPECIKSWSRNFNNIINRFEATVVAQFYGHTHRDHFQIFYDDNRRPTNVAYISPSVTTYDGENPSYTIFTVDGNYPGSYKAIRDIDTYYFNLTEANALPHNKPKWTRAYNTKEKYEMNGLNPADWHNLTLVFENNDQLFQDFYRMYTMESDFEIKPCFGSCKKDMICALRSALSRNSTFCNTVK